MNIETNLASWWAFKEGTDLSATLTGLNADTRKIRVRVRTSASSDILVSVDMPAYEGMTIFFNRLFQAYVRKVIAAQIRGSQAIHTLQNLSVMPKTFVDIQEVSESGQILSSRTYYNMAIFPEAQTTGQQRITLNYVSIEHSTLQTQTGIGWRRFRWPNFKAPFGIQLYFSDDRHVEIYRDCTKKVATIDQASGFGIYELILENINGQGVDGKREKVKDIKDSNGAVYFDVCGEIHHCFTSFDWDKQIYVRWLAGRSGWRYYPLDILQTIDRQKRVDWKGVEFTTAINTQIAERSRQIVIGKVLADKFERLYLPSLASADVVQYWDKDANKFVNASLVWRDVVTNVHKEVTKVTVTLNVPVLW